MRVTLLADKDTMLLPTTDYALISTAKALLTIYLGRVRHFEVDNDLLALFRVLNFLLSVCLQHLRATLRRGLASNVVDKNVLLFGCLFLGLRWGVNDWVHMCKYCCKGKPLLIIR